ncbi:MAG: choice-of-anchor Q domain-containing protein [Kiritimatiellia bacterium]
MKSSPQPLPPTTYHLRPATRHLPRVSIFSLLLACLLACTAHAAEYLVATNGNDAASGMGGWANALRTIGAAVAKATRDGDIVTVSNGTYNITNQITIAKAITVRSFGNGVTGGLANASLTTIKQTSGLVVYVNAAGAVLDGFTVTGGTSPVNVAHPANGVHLATGTVQNCRITGNSSGYGGRCSGVGMYVGSGGVVTNCEIDNNFAHGVNGTAGIYLSGGTVRRSVIRNNDSYPGAGICSDSDASLVEYCVISKNRTRENHGGGFYGLGTVRNCLIVGNYTETGCNGGGVYLTGGTVESCTIVANSAGGSGGGIYRHNGSAGTVMNCIVYNNMSRDEYKNICNADANVTYTCTTNPVSSGVGCVTGDPLCRDAAAGNYGLRVGSPCIDKGSNQEWMNAVTDLDGKGRIFRDMVDMGAFEYWPDKPLIQNAGVTNLTGKSAMVRGNITWAGAAASTVIVYHGPSDGGTNPQDWANELRLPGLRRAGPLEATIAHSASNRVWCYRLCATNQYGASWADFTGGLTLSKVDVSVTRRESTEEKPAAFVISRPATAVNGPLDVYFTLSGTGINGRDYDRIDSPVVIPSGAREVRLIVTPRFNLGDQENKVVELTLATGGYTLGIQKSARILTRAE